MEERRQEMLTRNIQGILSVLLSFKRKPNQIRYQGSSQLAQTIAQEVENAIRNDEVFDFRRNEEKRPTLLILDRRDDPVSPLLTQYTYQAMIHELLGLNNNRCSLKGAPNVSKDLDSPRSVADARQFETERRGIVARGIDSVGQEEL